MMIFFKIILFILLDIFLVTYSNEIIRIFINLQYLKLKLFKINKINITVTGSFGKTTTCNLLYHVLKNKKIPTKLIDKNSLIGLPLSILNIDVDYWKNIKNKKIKWYYAYLKLIFNFFFYWPSEKINIIEVGIDGIGGMDKHLLNLPKYSISVLTNVDLVHYSNYKSIDKIIDEKFKLLLNTDKNGLIVYNNNCMNSKKKIDLIPHKNKKGVFKDLKIISVKSEIDDLQIKFMNNLKEFDINIKNEDYFLPDYLKLNIGIIWLVTNYLGINISSKDFNKFKIRKGRCNLIKNKKISIIDSSYNSSYKPLISLLNNFNNKSTIKNKILILGDMVELGDKELYYHKKVLKYIEENSHQYYKVYLVGNTFYKLNNDNYKSVDDLLFYLNDKISNFEDSYVLVKGSNSINLDKIVKFLTESK